jgi:hypothetical protein
MYAKWLDIQDGSKEMVHVRGSVLHLVGVGWMGGTPSKAAAVGLRKKQGMNKRTSY